MIIRVPKAVADCDDFVRNYLPRIILMYALENVRQSKDRLMNDYLKSIGVNHSVAYILKYSLKRMDCRISGDTGCIEISNTLKMNGYTLSQLCRLIDFGNAEVKGLNVLNNAFISVGSSIVRLTENYLTEI